MKGPLQTWEGPGHTGFQPGPEFSLVSNHHLKLSRCVGQGGIKHAFIISRRMLNWEGLQTQMRMDKK